MPACIPATTPALWTLLEQANAEFPNDAELGELEKLANDGLRRATEAHRLMTEGQELCAQDRFADGIKLLKDAYELDEHNALTRAVFSNALVEQARVVAEKNWQEAEQLAQQAFDLNPSHPLSKTVRTLILDQKREQIVSECLSQARKLQASGDLAGALSRLEEALAAYPRELRLVQIQETLQRELHAQRRQARRRDLEELRRTEREAETITDPSVKQVFGERIQVLAAKYLDDEEVLAMANGILGRLNLPTVQGKIPAQNADSEKARQQRTPGSLPYHTSEGTERLRRSFRRRRLTFLLRPYPRKVTLPCPARMLPERPLHRLLHRPRLNLYLRVIGQHPPRLVRRGPRVRCSSRAHSRLSLSP